MRRRFRYRIQDLQSKVPHPAGLTLETLFRDGVAGEAGGDDLDRDRAVQARVAGFVDFAHPAGTEPAGYIVGPSRHPTRLIGIALEGRSANYTRRKAAADVPRSMPRA